MWGVLHFEPKRATGFGGSFWAVLEMPVFLQEMAPIIHLVSFQNSFGPVGGFPWEAPGRPFEAILGLFLGALLGASLGGSFGGGPGNACMSSKKGTYKPFG